MSNVRLIDERQAPPTESRSRGSVDIDDLPTLEVLRMINAEDATVPGAVEEILGVLAVVVDQAAQAVRGGGRIHYFGAGTSGRFGVLDAAEVPPTYGVPSDLVRAHIAGGSKAFTHAVEDAEDSEEAGVSEAASSVRAGDVVIGIAASGRTPYVMGALRAARNAGAFAVALTANPASVLATIADVHICVDTGPEVVTGSTRMKAGTAQKLVLHTFSTALMVRLGHTFSNLMIDVVPTNSKLRSRVLSILREAAGVSLEEAAEALSISAGDTKLATVLLLTTAEPGLAEATLLSQDRMVRRTIDYLTVGDRALDVQNVNVGIDIGASGFRVAARGEGIDFEFEADARPSVSARGLSVSRVLDELTERLGSTPELASTSIGTIAVGMAGGAYFSESADLIAREFSRATGASTVACFPDSVAAYVGAFGFGPGAVLAAGTGSVAVASDGKSSWRQFDGLGHLLGDWGSGARIGQRGLECALDGSSPALAAAMLDRFGDVSTLVSAVYASSDRSAVLASFAPEVISAANAGDYASTQIIASAVAALADTLASAASSTAGPVAAVGGLIGAGGPLREALQEALLGRHGISLLATVGSPVVGAGLLAEAISNRALPALFQQRATGFYQRVAH